MVSERRAEAQAYLGWVKAVSLDQSQNQANQFKQVEQIEDLCDGVALFDLLAQIDPDYFKNPHGADPKDNWVLKIGTLKRLYKLMVQYYSEILLCSPQALPAPDLNAIAKSSDEEELCKLCHLAVGIAVHSEKNDQHIAAIQSLSEGDQEQLMNSINEVMTAIRSGQESVVNQEESAKTTDAADEFSERREIDPAQARKLAEEKATLEKVYMQLLEDQRALQTSLDDAVVEKNEAVNDLESYKRQVEESRNEQADALMRQEIERLKLELRRSEDNLAEVENENERLISANEDMKRKMEDLQRRADEAAKLKDQMDEFKHAAEKLQRSENVIEKYKKKLEEGADIRRQLKALEEQNAELVDRNAALEDEYKRVSAFKPLMDSYKSQISELESKASNLQRDLNTSRYDHEQTMSRLRASEDSRTKEKEEMELYQERIQELELGGPASSKRKKALPGNGSDGAESLAAADEGMSSSTEDLEDIGGELDDAITGTTMTDLKIKVRKLARELEAAKTNKADSSKILVLENLLDDAQRMKSRYEADYLREHKEKLVLQRELENIRSGKSGFGDGAEAAFALRVRLNEVVEELDRTKREFAALQVQTEHMTKDLTIAKSDLLLVNKDQVDILHSLRASVDVEKNELEAALKKVRLELGKAEEQNRMYMAQVNSLLMEKVDLQTEGIGQREEALRRERNLGELRASLAGKALPKEAEEMIANLQASTLSSEAQLKALQEKFQKAKLFIKQQDKMIKERDRNPTLASPTVVSGVGVTDEEVEKENKKLKEDVDILLREQRLMASAYHSLGLRYARELDTNGRSPGSGPAVAGRASYRAAGFATANGGPSSASWLGQQRRMVASGLTLTGK